MAKTRPTQYSPIRKAPTGRSVHPQYLAALSAAATPPPPPVAPTETLPPAAAPAQPDAIDLADAAGAGIKLILVFPADEQPDVDGLTIQPFVYGTTPLFDGVAIRSKPRLADQHTIYTKLINAPFLELIRVRNASLIAAGFNSCYVDEEGRNNKASHNDTASTMCGMPLVGRALFFRK